MTPTLFISYSHKDEIWKDRLLDQLAPLVGEDRLTIWTDRKIELGNEWFAEIEAAMNAASIAVCLISKNYLQSTFCTQYEVAPLLARRERQGLLLVPVLIDDADWKTTHWVKPLQMHPRDGRMLEAAFASEGVDVLTRLAEYLAAVLDDPRYVPPSQPDRPARPHRLDLTRLPYTGFDLVGRDAELARLNLAWRSFDTHVVCVNGSGGVGKSTLVNKWLEGLDADGFAGAETVFGWSFAGQAAQEREESADLFIHAALEWFGDRNPTQGSPWDRGERLAARIADQRALLVLDGIDGLQSNLPMTRGRISDPALATLLVELAQRNGGLCVVTSRDMISDLAAFPATVAQENLELLSPRAGRALLRLNGVRASDGVLEEASRAVGGNALSLRLLAPFLRAAPGLVPERLHVLLGDAGVGTGQEFRTLLAAIDTELGAGAAGEIVRALSLIAGGVQRDALRRLLGPPPAEGVNMAASALSDAGWQAAVRQLQTQELLLRQDDREDDRIEAHPLVCEYFAQHWRQNAPDSWREGHRRLAEDYLQAANARPVDVQEAAPLLKAIRHAALVGYANYVNSAVQLFHQRLDRGELFFANHLGAPGDVLSSLSAFFEPGGWSLVSNVADGLKAYLLNSTGTMLRALGRLEDAIAVYSQALTVRIAEEDWKNASKNASNLSELALVLGRIEEALAHATASVALARRSDDIGQVIYCLTTLADAQHQAGMTREAQSNFEEAERIHVERIARRGHRMPVLYRIPGIRYAEFLLTKGDFGQIAARVEYLTSAGPDISDEETAYGILVVADALRLSQPVDALRFTDEALTRLRRAASEIYLPRAHLVRARARSRLGDHDPALVDVDRALVIARRNNANLFVIDAQIERSRIELDRGNRDVARAGLEAAKGAIEKLGYLRRLSDIADVETRL